MSTKQSSELDTKALNLSKLILANVVDSDVQDDNANKIKSDLSDSVLQKQTSIKGIRESEEKLSNCVPNILETERCKSKAACDIEGNGIRSLPRQSSAGKSSQVQRHTSEKQNISSTSDDRLDSQCAKQFYVINRNVSMSPTHEKHEHLYRNSAIKTRLEDSKLDKATVNTVSFAANNDFKKDNLISTTIYRDNSNKTYHTNSEKTDLEKDIASLEKRHAEKLERNKTDYHSGYQERKIDLSNKDVNANRPSVLGPSRFETGGVIVSSSVFNISNPRRNDTIHSLREAKKNETISSSNSTLKSEVKTLSSDIIPTTSNLSKSKTTADFFSPETRRRKFDSNFNAVPEPFKSYGSTAESSFKSGLNDTSYLQSSSRNIDPPTSSKTASYSNNVVSSPSPSLPSYSSSTYNSTLNSTVASPSKLGSSSATTKISTPVSGSTTSSRAKSEGNSLLMPTSSKYKDFYHQIQATKDRYKSDVEKAMNFDRTTLKPPVIKEKLPRPDMTPSTLGRDYTFRRQERESTVMRTLMNDRSKRGHSDEMSRSSSFRY